MPKGNFVAGWFAAEESLGVLGDLDLSDYVVLPFPLWFFFRFDKRFLWLADLQQRTCLEVWGIWTWLTHFISPFDYCFPFSIRQGIILACWCAAEDLLGGLGDLDLGDVSAPALYPLPQQQAGGVHADPRQQSQPQSISHGGAGLVSLLGDSADDGPQLQVMTPSSRKSLSICMYRIGFRVRPDPDLAMAGFETLFSTPLQHANSGNMRSRSDIAYCEMVFTDSVPRLQHACYRICVILSVMMSCHVQQSVGGASNAQLIEIASCLF